MTSVFCENALLAVKNARQTNLSGSLAAALNRRSTVKLQRVYELATLVELVDRLRHETAL